MMKILSVLVLIQALFAAPLFALDDTENISTSTVKLKKGEDSVMQGRSQGLGYEFKFKDNKDAKLHIWGLARMYFHPESSSNKVAMPHFRFYVDGQKNENWSFHARIDHAIHIGDTDYHKISDKRDPSSETTKFSPTPYFARAYMEYKSTDIKGLSTKVGRVYNQAQKFDVLAYNAWDNGATDGTYDVEKFGFTIPQYQVSEGAQVDYVNGELVVKGIITYEAGATTGTEKFLYSSRAGYGHKLTAGKIEYGVAATTSSNNTEENQFVEVKPDFYFATKGGFWIFDQAMVKDMISSKEGVNTSDYEMLFSNYFEIGQTVKLFGKDVDLDAYFSTQTYDGKTASEVGVETFVKFKEDFRGFVQLSYEDVLNEVKAPASSSNDLSNIGVTAFLSKYF